MIPVPISEAEAIFAPFFDGSDSNHPTDKASWLDDFVMASGAGCVAHAVQSWAGVQVCLDSAPVGVPALTLTSREPLAIAGYDTFRVFGALPGHVRLRITGTQDGKAVTILEGQTGNDEHDEIDGALSGEQLDTFRLEFSLTEARPAVVDLRWLGLANRAGQDRLEARTSPFQAAWPHCLVGTDPDRPTPQIGIYFNDEDLSALREKCLRGPLKPMCDALREQVQPWLQLDPEAMVGPYVPAASRRFIRVRDHWKDSLYWKMEPLAFLGLIDENPTYSRMAARMALAAAHCTHWCETIMSAFPGGTWAHRSFQETYYSAACALVLDWAGDWITPHGKQLIRDAIVMKGLPRMESDFKRQEYIRYMNQGIVFSIGRILGLLALLPAFPRYASQLAEAEADLHEMIDAYIQDDGVILEGPGYWSHTFLDIIPLYAALARHHGTTLKDYATEKFLRAGDYALSLLSTRDKGLGYLGINDAHNQGQYPPHVIAAYCEVSDRPEWPRLLAGALDSGHSDVYGLIVLATSDLDLTHLPHPEADEGRRSPARFEHFPVGGQAASVRQDPDLGAVHLHLCSGPTYAGHYHEDKGSFLLEAAGQALVIDPGIMAYHKAGNALLGTAAAHSLLYPEAPDGHAPFCQPAERADRPGDQPWGTLDPAYGHGGVLSACLEEEGLVCLACDNAPAWEDGLFMVNQRRIVSPSPRLFLVEDVVELEDPLAMSFRLATNQPTSIRGSEAWLTAPGVSLRVAPVNWHPAAVEAVPGGKDDHDDDVTTVRLVTAPATTHRLVTLLELLPQGAPDGLWRSQGDDDRLTLTDKATTLTISLDETGCSALAAECPTGTWHIAADNAGMHLA